MLIRKELGLPTLAKLNLVAAASEAMDGGNSIDDIAAFIQLLASLVEDLSADEVLRDINEDRIVSGFPEVKSIDQVETELSERKRYYRAAIMAVLKKLPTVSLVDVMTVVVDGTTSGGDYHAPELIDQLVDSYGVEVNAFLEKEAQNVHKLIKAARDAAGLGESAIKPFVENLEKVAHKWDKVAQPIQLSFKARGIDHEPSLEIAHSIRNLAIDLFNEHGMLAVSQKITGLVKVLFVELPEVHERVEQDTEALANIFENRRKAEAQRSEWASEITYRAEVGLIFKDVLSISPDGVVWKNARYPLDAITRVRWGGVRRSVNGVPTGTDYTVAFGDAFSEAVVSLKNQKTYSTFTDKLWRAVAFRLLTELLDKLRSGKEVNFGEGTLRDDGITLVRHKFWNKEQVRFLWNEVHFWSADGAFYIGARNDKKTFVGLSYIGTANTHVVEQAMRMAFKKTGMLKLSEALQ